MGKNGKDDSQGNALGSAARFADKNTVQFLVETLEVDETETGFNGRNCFLLAASGARIETMKYLNSKFPDLKNGKDDNQHTALTLAAELADKNTVQFIIEQLEMDETETGFMGRNCFLQAAAGGKIETMRY